MIKAAVLGKPVTHSLSPLVHGQIYEKLGLEYSYQRLEHDQFTAVEFIRQALATEEWSGFSLTMPLKEVAFSLNLACDSFSVAAHSVNTITKGRGYNTDVSGLVRVLSELEREFESVAIIGSGATARSVMVALEAIKTQGKGMGKLEVFRRSSHGDALLRSASRLDVTFLEIENLKPDGSQQLIISTIPSAAQSSISSQLQGFEGTLLDITYSPWPSTLAGVIKGKVVSGLSLLVAQAVDQAALFTGLDFDREKMFQEIKVSTAREVSL